MIFVEHSSGWIQAPPAFVQLNEFKHMCRFFGNKVGISIGSRSVEIIKMNVVKLEFKKIYTCNYTYQYHTKPISLVFFEKIEVKF